MNPSAIFFQLRAFVKTKLTHVIQEKKNILKTSVTVHAKIRNNIINSTSVLQANSSKVRKEVRPLGDESEDYLSELSGPAKPLHPQIL